MIQLFGGLVNTDIFYKKLHFILNSIKDFFSMFIYLV